MEKYSAQEQAQAASNELHPKVQREVQGRVARREASVQVPEGTSLDEWLSSLED